MIKVARESLDITHEDLKPFPSRCFWLGTKFPRTFASCLFGGNFDRLLNPVTEVLAGLYLPLFWQIIGPLG